MSKKAILIMDMPKNCAECNLCSSQDGEYFCIPDDFTHYLDESYVSHNTTERPEWCPLKEVPKKRRTIGKESENDQLCFNGGYNACIDEILEGSEVNE